MRLLCLLPAALFLAACSAAPRPSAQSPVLGQPARFALPISDGALFTVPTESSTPLVLDFFAPTCVPCRTGVPALMARKADIEARGAKLVLVAVLADGESTESAQQALSSWGVQSPFLADRGNVSRRELGVEKLPATVVLDSKAVVRWVAPADAEAAEVVSAVAD